ncbi:MAG: hypothetical protein V4489_06675 [Chlamydiota bacterium]
MKGNKNSKLSPRQLQALPYLVSSSSYQEAARQSGISAKQIYSWLKDPLFQQELERQRNEAFTEAMKALKRGAQKAVSTLIDSLDDPSPKIRLTAAEKILSNAFHAIEFCETEERINQIEKRVDQALQKELDNKRAHA